jgi:hypothetical protein
MTKGKRKPTAEEKQKALRKAEVAFNASQQSSEAGYLSTVQVAHSPLHAAFTTYKNASFALHRLTEGGLKELWKLTFNSKYRQVLKKEWGGDAVKSATHAAISELLQGLVGETAFVAMHLGMAKLIGWAYGGLDDDEDRELKKQFVGDVWLSLFNGMLATQEVVSTIKYWNETDRWRNLDVMPMLADLQDSVHKLLDAKGWGETSIEALSIIGRYGVGVDPKTWYNMLLAIDASFEGAYDEAETFYTFINGPKSVTKMFLYDRRNDETEKQYIERIMRFYTLFESIRYEDYFNEDNEYIGPEKPSFVMSKKEAQELHKEYEKAYVKNITNRWYSGGYVKYMELDEIYESAVKALGWTPEKNPNYNAYSKRTGEYITPTFGISEAEYGELMGYEAEVAYQHKVRENFAGTDEDYFEHLKAEIDAKQQFIDKYHEYIN